MDVAAAPHPSADEATSLLHRFTGPLDPATAAALADQLERMSLPGGALLLRLSKAGYDLLVARAPQALGMFARVMAERLARSARSRAAADSIRANPFVTIAECEDAVATRDPVMLNLRITQLYHRIALDLTVLLGAQDVNLFGFACRASKTAGSAIRGEDVPVLRPAARFIAMRLPASMVQRLRTWTIVRRMDAALERVLATLAPGPSESGGQDLLRGAVTAYDEAAFETHPKRRAELMLLGSLEIGLHEQIRVDPIIDEALDRPMADVVAALAPWLSRLPASWRAEERARAMVCRRARRVVTARIMRIRLPYGDLRLGDDLPELPAKRLFPDLLATLEHPELAAVFQRFDRGARTRAIDWSELDDRMRYIANFFRSRQKSLELFEPPFLFEQQAAIVAGRVPERPL